MMYRNEIIPHRVLRIAGLITTLTACAAFSAWAQGQVTPKPDRTPDFPRMEKPPASLPPNERQAWILLFRMMKADKAQSYIAREIRQFGEGKESEQWLRVDPDRGIRIENIRPNANIILDNRATAYFYEPKDKKWTSRKSIFPKFRGLFLDTMRRLTKGELKAVLDGQDTVASRSCAIVRIAPTEGIPSPSHRYWIDKATGLRMKMEIVGPDGRIFTTSYFVTVDLTPQFRSEDFTPPENATPAPEREREPVRTFKSIAEAQQARVEVPEPGYIPSGYTLQKIDYIGPEAQRPRVSLRYSNGLSVLSLTQFKVDRLPPRLKEQFEKGTPGFQPNPRGNGERAYLWQSGNNAFILFSALPDDEVKRIAEQVR